MLLSPLLIAIIMPGASVLNLVVFQDASGQVEHLLPASHLRKTSNRLLSSFIKFDRIRWRSATAHAQTKSQISCGLWLWMGMGVCRVGGGEGGDGCLHLPRVFWSRPAESIIFVQLCKNVDFQCQQHLLYHGPSPPPLSHPTPPHPTLPQPSHSLSCTHTSQVFRRISY